MGKFIKTGRVVIVTTGRFAGKKAVVVKNFDEGDAKHKFPHALIAGIERAPLKVTKGMSKKRIEKRSRVKPFIKYINYNHLMPTRYAVNDIDLKNIVTPGAMEKVDTKVEAKKEVKKVLEKRYLERGKNTPGVQYIFSKLRF